MTPQADALVVSRRHRRVMLAVGALSLLTVVFLVVAWRSGWLTPVVTDIPTADVRRATSPIALNGALDEAAWQAATPLRRFVISTDGRRAPRDVEARLVWDDEALYVAFDVDDDDLVASFTQRDDPLYTEDVVELFVDHDGDGRDYVELEVSPRGTLFDARFPSYRKALDHSKRWNLKGFQAAVSARDGGWRAELRVPFEGLPGGRPSAGTRWRAHLYRIDQHPDGSGHYSAWSPPLKPDFHVLDRMGTLVFTP